MTLPWQIWPPYPTDTSSEAGVPGTSLWFGGSLNSEGGIGDGLIGNGNMTGGPVDMLLDRERAEVPSAFAQSLVWFAWVSESATATTVMEVLVNNVQVGTLALTGLSGVIACDFTVAVGDVVALTLLEGIGPDGMLCCLSPNIGGVGATGATGPQGAPGPTQLTQDQVDAIANAAVAADPTNPFLSMLSPQMAISRAFAVVVANGTTETIAPAAPAGFVSVVSPLLVMNDSALTAAMNLLDGGRVIYKNTAFGASAGVNIASHITSDALTLECLATQPGGPMQVMGTYFLVPEANLRSWYFFPTVAWTSIPALTPPAGKLYRAMSSGYNALTVYTMNSDSASTTVRMRVIRDGVTYNIGTAGVVVGAGSRSTAQIFGTFPVFAPGDDVQCQVAVAPVTAGAVLIGGAGCLTDILV